VSVTSSQTVAGWYGKLPGLGDFASRRLSDEFIHAWDAWLQEVLRATRATLGEGWLDCYLTMPIWRFVLLPGLVGPTGWAGVLMPSVDRVGRQFPLTLALSLPSYVAAAHAVFRGGQWLAGLEAAALGVLDPTRGPDDLDRALADHAFASPAIEELDGAGLALRRLSSTETFETLAEAEALRAWSRQGGWNGLWWTQGRVDGDPLLLTCAKLPAAEEFVWLLESRAPAATSSAAGGAERVSDL
jgi:type VI secretion system protein ImpM